MDWTQFDAMIQQAFSEDGARNDATTNALVPPEIRCEAVMTAKQEGVLCGLGLAERVCTIFDQDLELMPIVSDGNRVATGREVARFQGPAGSLLKVERTMLNFLQRLSGVASLTRAYVDAIEGTDAKILDTRKTTPGWRKLEKYAVRCGGGTNHRMGLDDMVLIKDNHLKLCAKGTHRKSVDEAIRISRDRAPGLSIEVEVENLDQLRRALAAEPDYVLLDNLSPEKVNRACELARSESPERCPQLEASGAIDLKNVREYAEAGVDRISIGALTHSAPSLDLSLNIS